MTIRISPRPATHADIDMLALLATQTFLDTFGHLYQPSDIQSHLARHCSADYFIRLMQDDAYVCMVVQCEATIVAYSVTGPLDMPVPSPITPHIQLHKLYVDSAYKRQGIGRQLIQQTIEQATQANLSAIYLSVFSENESAIAFYNTHNFTKVGEYDYYVGDHIDREFMMQKRL